MTDPIDIASLDDDANRMRVSWKKMIIFADSFARELQEHRELFAKQQFALDHNGNAWTFSRWMVAKVKVPETTALRVMGILADRFSVELRQRERDRLREIAAEKKAERARLKAEQAAEKQHRQVARAAKQAPAQLKVELPTQRGGYKPRTRPQSERAVQIITERMGAGLKVDKHQIAKEMGISVRSLEVPMRIAHERLKHLPLSAAKTNGGDPLAARGHAAWAKIEQGNELWIEGVMELAAVMAAAREQFPADQHFGVWLATNKLERNKDDRAALINLGRMRGEMLRDLLKTSRRDSIRLIWKDFREGRFRNAAKPPDEAAAE